MVQFQKIPIADIENFAILAADILLIRYIGTPLTYICMQEPKKIILGTRRIYRGHGRKRRLVKVTDTLVYVPLLQTIETLLKDEGIYTEVCY